MRKIKEILRLKWLEGRRHRHIARALGVSVGKVSEVAQRAAELGFEWERVERLGEAELEEAIYGAVHRRCDRPRPPSPRTRSIPGTGLARSPRRARL